MKFFKKALPLSLAAAIITSAIPLSFDAKALEAGDFAYYLTDDGTRRSSVSTMAATQMFLSPLRLTEAL